jgi:hypothetical protein
MATRKIRQKIGFSSQRTAALTEYAEILANAWLNGNTSYVISEIRGLSPITAAYVAVRVHMSLERHDDYAASSFVRRLESSL